MTADQLRRVFFIGLSFGLATGCVMVILYDGGRFPLLETPLPFVYEMAVSASLFVGLGLYLIIEWFAVSYTRDPGVPKEGSES